LETCVNGLYPGNGGGALKEAGTTHWAAPNTGATNSTGFKGLPGGARAITSPGVSAFFGITEYGNMWSSTAVDADLAYYSYLWNSNAIVNRFDDLKKVGFSVRCIKD
jgi:uncharacterized protein (TIGR02145 family)